MTVIDIMNVGVTIDFKISDYGCIVPTSHKLNKDGYFRTRDTRIPLGTGARRRPLIMAHRLVWEMKYGTIPDGYEIDHLCHNRACCNVYHLRCIPIVEHKIHHNSTRYKRRFLDAKAYWKENKPTGVALAFLFGVTSSTANEWIREWKNEQDNNN